MTAPLDLDTMLGLQLDNNYFMASQEDYITRSLAEGFSIRFPLENELYIDIDNDTQYSQFKRAFNLLKKHTPSVTYIDTPSYSHLPHRHIVVTLPFKVGYFARIALQASLGSDSFRELLSVMRALQGERPTLFRERK